MHYILLVIITVERTIYKQVENEGDNGKLIKGLELKLQKPFEKFIEEGSEIFKFDDWSISYVVTVTNFLKNIEKLNRFPQAIFTSQCKWIEPTSYRFFVDQYAKNSKEFVNWKNRTENVLKKCKSNEIVAYVDCHV